MTPAAARYIKEDDNKGPMFSVCTLVRSQEKYDRMLASYHLCGFSSDTTEYLAADNRDTNRYDGYTWQKALLAEARGHYVIFCHDDVELLHDGQNELLAALHDLNQRDSTWLLVGVAGGRYRPDKHHRPLLNLHITDPWGEDRRRGKTPGRVETLDECFLLMRRSRPVVGSSDLSGFHFYGPDLCMHAELQGGSAYAIDFHLHHHGRGTKDQSFFDSRSRFVKKYASIFPSRWLHCTTGVVQLVAPLDVQE